MGGQSNQRHAEDTNNSSRREAALLISILHGGKSCQRSLRQTAVAFHTFFFFVQHGLGHGAIQCRVAQLPYNVVIFALSKELKDSLRSLSEVISHHVKLAQVLSSKKPNNGSVCAEKLGQH